MAIAETLEDGALDLGHRLAGAMDAFEEVALATMRASFDLDDVLQLVGRRLCELLGREPLLGVPPRRRRALPRPDRGGHASRDIRALIQRLVSGMGGRPVHAGRSSPSRAPVLVRDAQRDPRTIQRTMRRWAVRDMLGVPLVVDHDVIGIIYVDNEQQPHAYTDEARGVAQAFAGLAADRGCVRDRCCRTLDQRARLIDRQRVALQRLEDAHERFTRVVPRRWGRAATPRAPERAGRQARHPVLADLPNVTASRAPDGDAGRRRAGAAGAGAGDVPRLQRVPGAPRVRSSGAVLVAAVPAADSPYRRLICPLVVDRRPAGYLEITEMGRGLDHGDDRVLERAATTVSMQLLAERRQADAEGQGAGGLPRRPCSTTRRERAGSCSAGRRCSTSTPVGRTRSSAPSTPTPVRPVRVRQPPPGTAPGS